MNARSNEFNFLEPRLSNHPPKVWGYSWGSNPSVSQRIRSPDQIFHQAIAAYQRGDFAGAIALCLQMPPNAPQFTDALNMRAAAVLARGDRAEAVILMAQVVALIPAHPIIQANFGAILGPTNPSGAAPLRRAVQLDPNDAGARINLAIALANGSDRRAAIVMFTTAAVLAPGLADVWFNFGSHDKIDRSYRRGLCHLGRALVLNPSHFDGRTQFAQCLSELGEHGAAIEIFGKLAADFPKSPLAFSNLGSGFQAAQKYDEALGAYDHALQLDPNHARTRYNRACLLLARGDFANGFADYEWRWQANAGIQHGHKQPIWTGENLNARSVLLHAEQGFGDVIQFVRFAPMVKSLGADVFLGIHAPLAPLIRNSFPGITIISADEIVPPVDYQCPLMSLPHVLNLNMDTIRVDVPYLHPSRERVDYWSGHIKSSGRLHVGLAWSGNPEHENDRNRSMKLETLAPLLNLPDMEFYILQKGLSDSDQAVIERHENLHHCGFNFAETAALMCNLDVVISVDTSIAHLAGALGLPTWVMLAIPCDWRWQYDRADCPWYPTMRLFRQRRPGDWVSVLGAVRDQLIKLTDAKPSDRR